MADSRHGQTVPLPELPTELVHDILHRVGEDGQAPNLQAHYDTLRHLSLVSRSMHSVAFPHLHKRVVLPTLRRAERFVRTVESVRWAAMCSNGQLRNLVTSLAINLRPEDWVATRFYWPDCRLVGRLLRGLDRSSLRRLHLENMTVGVGLLTGLTGQ